MGLTAPGESSRTTKEGGHAAERKMKTVLFLSEDGPLRGNMIISKEKFMKCGGLPISPSRLPGTHAAPDGTRPSICFISNVGTYAADAHGGARACGHMGSLTTRRSNPSFSIADDRYACRSVQAGEGRE